MDLIILLAFVIYFTLVILVGAYFYKRSHNMEDYILGGRSMNPYVTAMSAQASDMSGWLLMGLPGAILLCGMGEIWIGIGLAAGSYLSWLFIAKRLRKHTFVSSNSLTLPEFYSNRFGDTKGVLRFISSVIILFFFVIYVASGFKGCGTVLQVIFPELNITVAIIVGAVIIIAYTFLGGYKAVCWTDLFQALLMLIGIIVVAMFTINSDAVGGFGNLMSGLDSVGVKEFTNLFWDGGEQMAALTIIGLLAWGFGYFGMPHVITRYMSIRDPEEVKVSRRVSLIWIVLALGFVSLLALAGRIYVQKNGAMLDPGFNAEHIFIILAGDIFAPFIAGILFAALMAAIMSTADSQLLIASSCITNDILGKSKNHKYSEDTLMWVSRMVVVVVAVLAAIMALYAGKNIMGLVSYAWAGFGAAFGPLTILALYWKRMNKEGAIAAMIVGFLTVIIWNTFLEWTHIYELLPGFVFSLIAGIVVALLTPEPGQAIQNEFDEAVKDWNAEE